AAAEEIFFTSGGTEADNIAIFGSAAVAKGKKHLITSAVEHHAVLDSCKALAAEGFDLTILDVDEYGMVQPETLRQALRPDTFLVTIMHANNEVGTINPIKELAEIAHQGGALFHVDAVQSVGKIPVDVNDLGVDMLTYSAHKINGPKGVGALYKRENVRIQRRVYGGGQEKKLRSGTENTPGIVGFGVAAKLTEEKWRKEMAECSRLREILVDQVLTHISHSRLNGHPTERLPHNANLSFDYIEGEALLLHLDMQGIACSTGSACSSGSLSPSHVLTAMGMEDKWLHSALRFSLGYGVTEDQIRYTVKVLEEKVALLRKASPFYPG
ncbi:MAG: cysteine desulfurase family protein, partial [Clostridiales bacterium]